MKNYDIMLDGAYSVGEVLTFEEKVKKMTAKEEIICFGCAATNTICKITGKVFDASNISHILYRADFLNTNTRFLCRFENAIDSLRRGSVKNYNIHAENEFAEITEVEGLDLPFLDNNYTIEDLELYKILASMQ